MVSKITLRLLNMMYEPRTEVDRIWHLACPASPTHYQYNPIMTSKTSLVPIICSVFRVMQEYF